MVEKIRTHLWIRILGTGCYTHNPRYQNVRTITFYASFLGTRYPKDDGVPPVIAIWKINNQLRQISLRTEGKNPRWKPSHRIVCCEILETIRSSKKVHTKGFEAQDCLLHTGRQQGWSHIVVG